MSKKEASPFHYLQSSYLSHLHKYIGSTIPDKISHLPFSSFSLFIYLKIFKELVTAKSPKNWMIILPTEREAKQVYDEITELSILEYKSTQVELPHLIYFPTYGMLHFNYSHPELVREGLRARALSILASDFSKNKSSILIAPIEALSTRVPLLASYKKNVLTITKNKDLSLNTIKQFLVWGGYEIAVPVEKQGDFNIKGGLLDVFCPSHFNPIRIEFFGDTVESIRFFDPLTQISVESIDSIEIFPRRDLHIDKEVLDKVQKSREYQEFLQTPENERELPPFIEFGLERPAGFWDVYPLVMETNDIFSYYNTPPEILVWDRDMAYSRLKSMAEELLFLEKRAQGEQALADSKFVVAKERRKKFFIPAEQLLLSNTEIFNKIKQAKDAFFMSNTTEHQSLYLKEAPLYKGKVSALVEEMNLNFQGYDVFISMSTKPQEDRIDHILSAYKNKTNFKYYFVNLPIKSGFLWDTGLLLTDKEIFGKYTKKSAISKTKTQAIESFVDLKEGDYVVHIDHGIGRFVGLTRMQVGGNERDFLEIIYAGQAKIYVPVEKLNLIHRYIGSSDDPSLDHLGKLSTWKRTKQIATEAIEKIAIELLELYAKRESAVGFSFPADTSFQEEFEASFEYDETDDQINAINDVKKDMESLRPMDRLICGDVGYGKTEVAIRATFKAVMAGKQVAILCPTTILAYQHYSNFKKRFQNYPITVDFVSRFKTNAQKKEVYGRLIAGNLDVVIGTHALLSKEVQFKNLGLLVVDEEQKFGVVHKESIKRMRANIDTVTMSATPIPRTLQLSLAGIRDLSLIETPPRNRIKVETFVVPENDEVLQQAIEHEIEREGQVYVLHNKVETIEMQAKRIQDLVPSARIAILHGQMVETDIELIMFGFLNYEFDILVCTTIIESGVDIPNVNTLIVIGAQALGLSQLYQLKGRVGRSDRQAFAYFFYPDRLSINEVAQKRLNTLEEYDELGAGFKIAMKDLEIRGAGNILGKEQSGDIMAIGFDLYIQMLHEKIGSLRDEEKEHYDCSMAISQDFYIPDNYISDTRQKMEFYKKLVSANTLEAIESVKNQIVDRFGALPTLLEEICLYQAIRIMANGMLLEKIKQTEHFFILTGSQKTKLSFFELQNLLKQKNILKLVPTEPQNIYVKINSKDKISYFRELQVVLEKIWAK